MNFAHAYSYAQCIYIYIYIYTHLVRQGNRQDVFRMVSVVDIIQRFLMVSVIGFCFYGFRRGRKCFFMFSVIGCFFYGFRRVRKASFCLVSMLAAASEIISDSSQIRDRAGDTRARSDSDIAMRSPAAKDPYLTSGLRGFNPGRARFLKVIVFACFCLLVACFCLFFASFPSRGEKPRSRAEKQCYLSCFRYVSVAFPWRASPWPLPRDKCEGSLCQRAIIKETYVGAR